jgi:hypothetical protein
MATMNIIPVGTEVELQPDIFGTVLSVTIRNSQEHIYEVGWWSSRSYTKEHFYSTQFNIKNQEKLKIGFVK